MTGKVRLDRWGPHLRAAEQAGKTLTQYAGEHGLSRHTLYAARQMLKVGASGKRLARERPTKSSAFSAVKLLPATPPIAAFGSSAPMLRAQLPNGIALELSCDGADGALLRTVIDALARWPCSASTRR